MTEGLPEFGKKRGWPKGKPRKPPIPKRADAVKEAIRPSPVADLDWMDDDDSDRLKIPKHKFPDGMDLQWVTDSIYGAPTPQRRARFEKRLWEPVQTGDFDGRFDYFMPKGFKGQIEVDGLILCARPLELSIRSRQKERNKAVEQVLIKERQIMGGDIPQVGLDTRHESAIRTNRVNKSWERISVPSDD